MRTYPFRDEFVQLFTGNKSFYVEHLLNEVEEESKKGKKKCPAYFKALPVKEELYALHLGGLKGLGVCPINEKDQVHFAVIDIDNYEKSMRPIVNAIHKNNLPVHPCKSKSGGLHIYLFLTKPVKAASVLKEMERLVKILGLRESFGDKHVELFPKQASLSEDTNGNCITIPYFDADKPVSWLWKRDFTPYTAGEAVDEMLRGRTTVTALSEALDAYELGDAPPCIQTIVSTSALGEDSGRNNFLFTCAVYLKKKYGEDFESHLSSFNKRLQDPVSEKELRGIIDSIKTHEYNYKCKDIPCRSYCDKVSCAKREFGIGKDKGYFSGLEYGKIRRMMTEEPYYVWDLKFIDQEEVKQVVFKDETSLMDQRYLCKMCIRHLNRAPYKMTENEWLKTLNTVMKDVEDVAVAKATDTSYRAEIRESFVKYLTQKQTSLNLPVQMKMGFVYKGDGKYYFTHRGFEMFLEVERVKLNGDNLREILLSYGAVDDKLKYKSKAGNESEVPCWSKEYDKELTEIEEYYKDVFEADVEIIDMAAAEAKESAETEDEDAEDMF